MKKLLLVFALFGTQWYNKIKSQTPQRIVISTNKCDVIEITTSQNEQCTFKDTNLFFCQKKQVGMEKLQSNTKIIMSRNSQKILHLLKTKQNLI